MIILVIRAFLQIRKYLLGIDSGAFLSRYLFDWVFVFLFFFIFFYSNSFPALHNFDFNAYVHITFEEVKANPVLGLLKIVVLVVLWSVVVLHILILISILKKYLKWSSFAEPDVNRFIKFVTNEVNLRNWKKAFNMMKAKWYLVKESSVLLSCLGDTYVGLSKYEEAVGAYEESLVYATDDNLKVKVVLKAADIFSYQLKDDSSAIELINDTLRQSLEEAEYKILEDKKAEILSS